jgi:hypothetical protein
MFSYSSVSSYMSKTVYTSILFKTVNVHTSTLYTLRLDFHFLPLLGVFVFVFCVSPYWKRTVAQSTLSDIITTIGELRSPILRLESNPEPTVIFIHTPLFLYILEMFYFSGTSVLYSIFKVCVL